MAEPAPPQRVCVLANRNLLGWQVEALERAVEENDVEIPLVVVNETERMGEPGFGRGASPLGRQAYEHPDRIGLDDVRLFLTLLRHEGAWAFVLAEKKLAWMASGHAPTLMRRYPLDAVDVLAGAERLHCRPVPVDGNWCDLPGPVVDRIVDETDVVVRFGFNLLTGRIVEEPTYGVLSFHPGDIRKHRGLGPVQPFLAGDSEAGATLQQLTNELDGGNVVSIETVDITDAYTSGEVRRRVNRRQIEMLSAGLLRLRDPGFDPRPPDTLGPYTTVKERRSPRFAARVLAKNLAGRLRRLRTRGRTSETTEAGVSD